MNFTFNRNLKIIIIIKNKKRFKITVRCSKLVYKCFVFCFIKVNHNKKSTKSIKILQKYLKNLISTK